MGSLILVVEEQLSILGLTAIGVGTAEEGLASWREGGVGLIFTDLRLPRMSGVEMAAQVRTEEVGRSRIEIVGLSALGRDAEPDAGSPHLDRFLTKPVSLRMLERELDRLQIRAASELSDTTLSAPVLGSEPDLPLRPQYLQKIVGDDELVIRGFVLEFKRTQSGARDR